MTSADHFHDRDILLGVYADEAAARTAAGAARAAGAPAGAVRVAAAGDDAASLDAEMQEEMTNSLASPQAFGVVPKEAVKGAAVTVPVAVAIGVVVALPFAFLPLPGAASMAIWAKLLIAAVVGAAGGATVGFVVGAGFAAMGPGEPMAAERGVTVRVDDGRDVVEAALRSARPIRLDRLHPDGASTTVMTEADTEPVIDLRPLEDSARHPEGRWPPPHLEPDQGRPPAPGSTEGRSSR